jgi:hypothetical protein
MNIKQIALNPCPCGKRPTKLTINDGSTYRWREISGDCCGTWMIESSRIDYQATDEQIERQCIDDWNDATKALIGDSEPVAEVYQVDVLPDASGMYEHTFLLNDRLSKQTELYIYNPNPSLIAKEAECERYRKALEEIRENKDESHSSCIADEALKG